MIRRKGNMRVQTRENIRGGSGKIDTLHLLEEADTGGRVSLCSVMTIPPGGSIGAHGHDSEAEIFYVLEGELCDIDEGQEVTLYPGDATWTTGGAMHGITNRSDNPVKLLAIIIK